LQENFKVSKQFLKKIIIWLLARK